MGSRSASANLKLRKKTHVFVSVVVRVDRRGGEGVLGVDEDGSSSVRAGRRKRECQSTSVYKGLAL